MALSQMGVPGHTSGSDGVYRRSANSGIAEIDATRRLSWTDTFTAQVGRGGYRCVGPLSARSRHFEVQDLLIN
jgi:hypothetical protein